MAMTPSSRRQRICILGSTGSIGTSTLDVINGAAIMKITSSTSMTSISGVMLMSLIGCDVGLRSNRPNAI